MLDTKTGEVVPILTGLYEIRGLQIMDTMDMFFLERGGIEGCFGMLVVDGRMVGKAGEGEQLVKKELFKVWEKKKQGHCVRYVMAHNRSTNSCVQADRQVDRCLIDLNG